MASLVRRGRNYYLQWRIGSRLKRRSLRTTSPQIAREKLRNRPANDIFAVWEEGR